MHTLETIFGQNLSVVIAIDPENGSIAYANPTAASFYGYTLEEMLQLHISDISIHTKAQLVENMKMISEQKLPLLITSHKLRDGSIRQVQSNTTSVVIDNRKLNLAIVQDISKEQKALKELKESEARYKNLNQELKNLTTHLQELRFTERNKLAIDMHDRIGQGITAVRYDVDLLKKHLQDPDTDINAGLQTISDHLFTLAHSFKEIYMEVNPTLLTHLEISDALGDLVDNFKKKKNIPVEYYSNAKSVNLGTEKKLILYRSMEEAMDNISQHANATNISVSLIESVNKVSLHIEDNGCGFELCNVKTNHQFGILEMREWVQSAGGYFHLQSIPNKGTEIDISMPLV